MPAGEDHRHCKICGKMTGPGNETCSAACAATREARLRQRRNYQYLLFASIALVAVVFFSGYFR